MIQRVILICVAASIGVVGCGGSDGGGAGGEAGEGGTGDAPGTGGDAGGGAGGGGGDGGGDGGGGEGGAGGEAEPLFTSSRDWTDAGLAYQLESCQCQGPGEPISESACLALAENLPFSDRQNDCFDDVILGEEYGMSLENRFACFVDIDLAAVDCLAEVNECSESAITDCRVARDDARTPPPGCPTPHETIRVPINECQETVVEDGVDAFVDSQSARCDCLTNCSSSNPDPEDLECMMDALQARVEMLGPDGPMELKCITAFWRRIAVCFGNEVTCDGAETACADIPPMVCAISGTILDHCLPF